MNKEELTERLKNLKGNPLSLKNQSINYITSQQYKLKIDLENWNNQQHASLDKIKLIMLLTVLLREIDYQNTFIIN